MKRKWTSAILLILQSESTFSYARMSVGFRSIDLLLGIPIIPLTYIDLIRADKDAMEKFGDEYGDYMRRVPRANFLLGIMRWLQRRNSEQKNRNL